MTFKFRWLCELLRDLDANRVKKAATASKSVDPNSRTIVAWFNKHNLAVTRHGDAAVAFLSCLFPERRADRVYNIQEKRISTIVGRSLCLGTSRKKELDRWRERDGADFAQCVEAVMAQAENIEAPPGNEVTLEELNEALDQIAAKVAFSSPGLRARALPCNAYDALEPILHRLQSWEAKWLIRMLLKTYTPVVIPERLAMQQFHFLLPDLLTFQNSFAAVAKILGGPYISLLPARPTKEYVDILKLGVANDLTPQIGVMVGRPPYHKARSIKHCCQMAGRKRMSVERKYDGEYCQIHIDLTKGKDCIKIFSKSGKNSTLDRIRLHGGLEDCLKLGTKECKISHQCILEGELLVWSDALREIQPFHKIRKHAQRSGRYLGNNADSPASVGEHLMVMFYDILVLDTTLCMKEPHSKRRQRLQTLIHPIPGYADIGSQEIIDFASKKAPEQLRRAFAHGITQRWEGFVLKGCGDPYSSFNHGVRCIKLKKDYICGLGDTADLAIVGGRRDPKIEQELGIGQLHWTHFYVGCLENKEQVKRFDAKPIYRLIDALSLHNITKDDILFLNQNGNFVRLPYTESNTEIEVKVDQPSMLHPQDVFKQTFVVEIMGAGFDKPADVSYYSLRFPRVVKVHADRTARDAISFDELQELARYSCEAPADSDSQEDRRWIEKLVSADGVNGYLVDESLSTIAARSPASIRTASTVVTPLARSKMTPPLFVRVDSQELLPGEERSPKKMRDDLTHLTPSHDDYSTPDLKRKLPSTTNTSHANIATKRIKISSTANAETYGEKSLSIDSAVISTPSTGNVRSFYRRTPKPALSRLKRTPPWCRWEGKECVHKQEVGQKDTEVPPRRPLRPSSTAITPSCGDKTPRPNSGEPLSEVTNVSERRSRRTPKSGSQNIIDKARERGSPILGSASALRKKSQTLAGNTAGLHFRPKEAMPLPTPPTSSPDDHKAGYNGQEEQLERHAHSIIEHQHQVVDLKGLQRDPLLVETVSQQPLVGKLSPFKSLPFALPLLLSDYLPIAGTHESGPSHIDLQGSEMSFTYSTNCFLTALSSHAVAAGEDIAGVVLIDTTRPDAVATQMKSLADRITTMLHVQQIETSGKVLLLDCSVLKVLARASWAESGMDKKWFGGCLAWMTARSIDEAAKEIAEVRAIWNWDEAFTGILNT